MNINLSESITELMEQTISDLMKQFMIPGMSLAILSNDQIIYSKVFGSKNLEKNIPTTMNTLYMIGSTTKSFTALAIMQLVQEGKLKLDDPVNNYLPFKLGKKDKPITIHHLLSHSSGIPNLGQVQILIGRLSNTEETGVPMSSWDDFFTFINGATQEINAEPGMKFYYLNEGYLMLQAIIEKVTETNFEEFVRRKILKPLKMNRSRFLDEELKNDKDVSTPYIIGMGNGKPIIKPIAIKAHFLVHGMGGLASSVMELTNYLKLYFNGGTFEANQIVDKSLLNKMTQIQVETKSDNFNLFSNDKIGYGYGWRVINDFYGHKLVFHTGSTRASGSILIFMPQEKIGIVMCINSGSDGVLVAISMMILMAMLGKDPMKDFPPIIMQQKLTLLTGIYETYKGLMRVTITNKNGILYCRIHSNNELLEDQVFPLIPETEFMEDFRFFTIDPFGSRLPIEFIVKNKKKIDLIVERDCFHKISNLP